MDCQLEIDAAVQYVMATGQYFEGEALHELEQDLRTIYSGADAVLTNSGTSALWVALNSVGIKNNSFVAVPAVSYAATAQAVLSSGFFPMFIDIDEHFLMDMDCLDRAHKHLGNSLGGVISVDLYGQGVDLDVFIPWCHSRGLPIILDSAQSIGLHSPGAYDQTEADAVCLSFNPLKNWGGHGGGAVITREGANEMRSMTRNGKSLSGLVETVGGNLRMDSLQAAVLRAKKDYCGYNLSRKREIHKRYLNSFRDIMPKTVQLQDMNPYVSVIAPVDAARVRSALDTAGIEHRSHYDRPLNLEPQFDKFRYPCPRAESYIGRLISLPNHWHLRDDELDYIIHTVKSAI